MSDSARHGKELEVQEKQEVTAREQPTVHARYYQPLTDIYETGEALVIVMEIPGVDRPDIKVTLENDMLDIEARISLTPYSNMKPLYTEYGVGHYARHFRLPNVVNREAITAHLSDGVVTLTLPKIAQATARSIEVQ
jgi:HSP20 family protein